MSDAVFEVPRRHRLEVRVNPEQDALIRQAADLEATTVSAFVLETVTETLSAGDEVSFTGFGKFKTQHRKERQGVNPRNPSQKLTIPAARVPRFSAGSTLKQAVKGG